MEGRPPWIRNCTQIRHKLFFKKISQNRQRWPFWMTENHFRSHFSSIRSIRNFLFVWIFSQIRQRRPFLMTENHFRLHFSPFQINTQLFIFFYKIGDAGHFGWPKITFHRISRHFRSIRNFPFFLIFLTKSPPPEENWPIIYYYYMYFLCCLSHVKKITSTRRLSIDG